MRSKTLLGPITSLLTALSCCFLVLVVVFWFRSITVGDSLTWHRSPRQIDALSLNGVMQIGWGEIVSPFPSPEGWTGSFWPFHRSVDRITADGSLWSGTWLGFLYEQTHRRTPTIAIDYIDVRIPYWFLAFVMIVLPVWKIAKYVRRRRKRDAGACLTCGYDLRAHRPGDKCPECGTPVPALQSPDKPPIKLPSEGA